MDTGEELNILRRLLARGFQMDTVVLVYCLNDISDIVPESESAIESVYSREPDFFLVRDTYFFNFVYHRIIAWCGRVSTDYYAEVLGGYDGPIWESQRQRLEEMVRLCREAGVEFRTVTFPFLHDLGPNYRFGVAHQRLSRLWQELEVPHIDLVDAFSAADRRILVVNRFDPQPNELTHRRAAREILNTTAHLTSDVAEFARIQFRAQPEF